jgi:prepilin-type N-terminal cleavage/methylation domain-containing protein
MNKKGVTLIELVVVFAIIGIAAALATPGIGAWMPKYRLRSATRDIVSTMRDAQMRAVTNNTPYQVNFNVAPNGYVLQHTSGGVLFTDGATQTAPSGITINIAGLPGGMATFNTDCTCPNGGTITVSYQKGGITQAQRGVVLSASTGRARIVE